MDVKGGRYTAKQNGNGSWDIFRVPILCAHERNLGAEFDLGKDGKPVKVDRIFKVDAAWLSGALKRAKERYEKDAYLAPLHIRHHGTSETVARAGFMLPCEVGEIKYDGEAVPCLFADFVQVPDGVYAEIKKNGLPYVSVEILDTTANAEIDSCALMDHVVPYFKFPLLTIGQEIGRAEVQALEAGATAAFARRGKTLSILTYMKPGEDEKEPEKKAPEGEGKFGKDPEAKAAGDESKEAPAKPEAAKGDATGGLMNQIMTMLNAIMGRLGIQMGGGALPAAPIEQGAQAAKPEDKKAEAPPVPAIAYSMTSTTGTAASSITVEAPKPVVAAPKADGIDAAAFAALKGEMAALTAKLAAKEAEEAIYKKADGLAAELAVYGVKRDDILAVIKQDPANADKLMAAFSAAVKAHGVKDPAPRFGDDVTVSNEAYPAEVLAYSNPEKVRQAAKLWQDWKAVKAHGCGTPLKAWLENLMESPFQK